MPWSYATKNGRVAWLDKVKRLQFFHVFRVKSISNFSEVMVLRQQSILSLTTGVDLAKGTCDVAVRWDTFADLSAV